MCAILNIVQFQAISTIWPNLYCQLIARQLLTCASTRDIKD